MNVPGLFFTLLRRPSDEFAVNATDASRVDDVVRRVKDATLMKYLAVPCFGQLVVGGTRDDVDL